MFLDLERLGLAAGYYPAGMYGERRREVTRLGYACDGPGLADLDGDLAELPRPYVERVAA